MGQPASAGLGNDGAKVERRASVPPRVIVAQREKANSFKYLILSHFLVWNAGQAAGELIYVIENKALKYTIEASGKGYFPVINGLQMTYNLVGHGMRDYTGYEGLKRTGELLILLGPDAFGRRGE